MSSASGLASVRTRLTLHIAPFYAQTMRKGILAELNRFIMTYRPGLGVPLAFSQLSYADHCGLVNSTNADSIVTVGVTFTVFSPVRDAELVGIVNKVSSDHIGLVVHGVFNCSIASTQLPDGAYYEEVEDTWMLADQDNAWIGEGQRLRFKVLSVAADGALLMIQGSLVGVRSPIVAATEIVDELAGPLGVAKTGAAASAPVGDQTPGAKRKKSKRKRSRSASASSSEGQDSTAVPAAKKSRGLSGLPSHEIDGSDGHDDDKKKKKKKKKRKA
eukprot:Amastigsp_a340130_95.p2 type:complete len:273 gc:universal Amastigsp_a340130_95:833-15(-)